MARKRELRPPPRLTWSRGSTPASPPAQLRREIAHFRLAPQASRISPTSRLVEGENEAVMLALLPEWEGAVDLIYADPPFLSGQTYPARIGRREDSRQPKEWLLTEGFRDAWEDPDQYLDMLYRRLVLMHRLLSTRGTLYLHLDWHASAWGRLLLDEVFGRDRFLNEIVWVYHGPSPIRTAFKRKHDTILVYTRGRDYYFDSDAVRVPYHESTRQAFRSSRKAGFGKVPDLEAGKVPEDWWYFPVVARMHKERTGFPTQKPEALMERILLASCPPDGTVADFFCGSGTTPAVAARLQRKWIACDASPLAVETTYRRLCLAAETGDWEVWRADLPDGPTEGLNPIVQVNQRAGQGVARLVDCLETAGDGPIPVEDLVLWEVGHRQGGTLYPVSQAVRPWRSGEFSLELKVEKASAGTELAARVVDRWARRGSTLLGT